MIRNLRQEDVVCIRGLWESAALPANCLPDTEDPIFIIKKCVEEPSGKVAMAACIKLTSEAYLLVDHECGDAPWRWETLRELTEAVIQEAKEVGIQDLTCWIPPHLEKRFGRRLTELGFVKSPWQSYSRLL